MKKLILLLLFVPLISFGQTAEDYFYSGLAKYNLKDLRGACADFRKAISLGSTRNVDWVRKNCN
ncbi:MAG: hypothetical protein VX325_06005 [Bacteroidota bacterium]|nr:hypothetical protein [Bacteroidota bacterium]